ncbi:MAG TPA: TIGR04086 family membrane protein [Clostridia bacterium]|nr:TIGR04086 family membrane protein [Clostridia bacterium]
MRKSKTNEAPNLFAELLKGSVMASAVSLVLIVIYAAAMWQQWLGTESIAIVNTGIKVVSAAVAGIVVARRCREKTWLYGAAAGLIYSAFAFVIFSILSDTFALTLAVLADFGIGILAGMLSAMIYRAAK